MTRGAIEDEIPALKREPGKDIVCFGGASFARALAAARLIDEYRLTVHPVVLGEGVPLLHGLPEPQRLGSWARPPTATGSSSTSTRRPDCGLTCLTRFGIVR